jgi:hypothetical protein
LPNSHSRRAKIINPNSLSPTTKPEQYIVNATAGLAQLIGKLEAERQRAPPSAESGELNDMIADGASRFERIFVMMLRDSGCITRGSLHQTENIVR